MPSSRLPDQSPSSITDPDLQAFLHIVHVSDMHCKSAGATIDVATERRIRDLIALLRRTGRKTWADRVEERWESGLAGHDPLAHDHMCRFLRYFATHPAYRGVETWLLDTGDLSALGDSPSLSTALGWLADYENILRAHRTLILHGNHDAWPGQFPLTATTMAIDQHQVALRSRMQVAWPQTGIAVPIPHSQSKLRLNAINSTTGERIPNTLARGVVDVDPPWKSSTPTYQLDELGTRTAQALHPDGVTRDFRIVAVHHPVHYPPPRPSMQMSLKNDRDVADAFAAFTSLGRGPLAHLVLSGHTHDTYPPLGALPPLSGGVRHAPLHSGQMQLIAGSLSQLPRYASWSHQAAAQQVSQQCQILTFFASPKSSERGQLLMERRVVGRGLFGPYKFLPPPGPPGRIESVLWEY